MDPKFASVVEQLDHKHQALLAAEGFNYDSLPRSRDMPERGIYLFTENSRYLYVGRTNRIRRRLAAHCRPSGSHNAATFAFRIARKQTDNLTATYRTKGSREMLLQDPTFSAAFTAAKERLRKMEIRFVQETDPVRQALLEIYVATVLETPYNDFDNH
jgi:predicted GIY-YIG superfamily endonuclease